MVGMYSSYKSRDCFPYSGEEVAGKGVDLVYTGRPYNILVYRTVGAVSVGGSCLGGCVFLWIISSCFVGPRRMRCVMRDGPPCLGRPIS
jgi:hypothetical protein